MRIVAHVFGVLSLLGSGLAAIAGLLAFGGANAVFQEIAGICLLIVAAVLFASAALWAAVDQRERDRKTLEDVRDRCSDTVDRLDWSTGAHALQLARRQPPIAPPH